MSEKLSALIDNELDELERARVLKKLNRDAGLAELWSRYHIIGPAMRREPVTWSGGLPERVARALDSEADASGKIAAPGRPGSLFRPLGRFAVAASAAAVLLVSGLVVKLYEDTRSGGAAPAGQQVAFDNDSTRWEKVDPQVEDALNTLLVEHGEFTSVSGMNGLTAYTKFVAYDSR